MPRVLIAEDNSANVLLIRDFCKDMDFEPMVVEDGRAIVEAVRSSPPDVILMDIDAPVVDGLAATIEIRGLHNVSEQMMIIGLNSDSPATAAACRIAGMNQILSKPLKPERLMAALRAVRAPLNLQATANNPEQSNEHAESDEVLMRRVADMFGSMPADTPCARLHYINAPKLAGQFGDGWADIAVNIEAVTRAAIEQHIGESAVYKQFAALDFILIAPGLTRDVCTAKCQAIVKDICRTLAADEMGARFHIRTVVFNARPAAAEVSAVALAAQARLENPDIIPWTSLYFWPVWDTQRRKFPLHSVRVDRDETGALLPGAVAAMRQEEGLEKYVEALDISVLADLMGRLEGHERLEQPRLLSIPLHFHTLESLSVMTRYIRYLEQIPKKIRERLIVEIHTVPHEARAVQIAELQKPLLPHCHHTMLVVPPDYANFNLLKQVSGQIVGLKLPEIEADAEPDLTVLKQFSTRAKQSGLTVATSMVRNRLFRDWGLTSCRYVLGAEIASSQPVLGPNAKLIT